MPRVDVTVTKLAGHDDLDLPEYMSDGASGLDLYAAIERGIELMPGDVQLVPTGIAVALPTGYEGQIRSRSGMALRHRVFVLNSPGTIDSDYRGEIGVILANFGQSRFPVARGDRIAQLVVAPVCKVTWVESDGLPASARQGGGFGHTDDRSDRRR